MDAEELVEVVEEVKVVEEDDLSRRFVAAAPLTDSTVTGSIHVSAYRPSAFS